jgi:hypothetical protein
MPKLTARERVLVVEQMQAILDAWDGEGDLLDLALTLNGVAAKASRAITDARPSDDPA